MFEKHHFNSIDSTHKWALRQDPTFFTAPVLITADEQTDSTGRRPHTRWLAPAQTALLATFVLPHFSSASPQNIAQLLALSLLTVLHSLLIFPLFKWPNDLLLSGKKLAGSMADLKDHFAVVSCGMNVNTSAIDLAKVDIPATSLSAKTGKFYDIENLAEKLALQFESHSKELTRLGFAPFSKLADQSLAYKETRVNIEGIPQPLSGIVKGIHTDGRLKLLVEDEIVLLSNGSLRS